MISEISSGTEQEIKYLIMVVNENFRVIDLKRLRVDLLAQCHVKLTNKCPHQLTSNKKPMTLNLIYHQSLVSMSHNLNTICSAPVFTNICQHLETSGVGPNNVSNFFKTLVIFR